MIEGLKPYVRIRLDDEVYVHGYVDEIRRDTVIIRNDGGYFGTVPHEVTPNTRANDNLSTDNDISADSHACNDTKMADSRERLEADIKKYRWEHGETSGRVTEWLDRQAAITEHEVKLRELYKFEENHRANIDATEEVNRKLNERIAELTAELETYRKYTEQGECEKLQSEENGDTREQLEADVHRAIFQWGWDSEWSRNEHRINECVVRSWLNRQAAITERECREQPCNNISCSIALGNQNLIAENRELHKHVDNLTAERDELETKHERIVQEMVDANTRQCERTNELTAERDKLRDIIDHMPKTEAECEACQDAHDRLMFNAKVHQDELRDELKHKQLVIDRQRDSFLKMEREYRELQDVCGELERTIENLRGD